MISRLVVVRNLLGNIERDVKTLKEDYFVGGHEQARIKECIEMARTHIDVMLDIGEIDEVDNDPEND